MDYPWDQHKRSERRVGHISVNYARGPVETIVDDSLGDEYSFDSGDFKDTESVLTSEDTGSYNIF